MRLLADHVSTIWIWRAVVATVIVGLLLPTGIAVVTNDPTSLRRGAIEHPANGTTVISVQGFKFKRHGNAKKPPRLVGVGPRGRTKWIYNGSGAGPTWFYDIDPLPTGNLLVVAAYPNASTAVYALNPDTLDRVWIERLPIKDTHDVDLINGDQLLVANMRNVNETANRNNARLFIYDRGTDQIVWEFLFRKHYSKRAGGPYGTRTSYAWIHLNDVDKIDTGTYLASPRNFDQVIIVNRSKNKIVRQLGSDGNHSVLYEQHNPQFLRGENERPTILVADSNNDRVVEYALRNGSWKRTWVVGTQGNLTWPRDADRLPNGNTLIVDTLNHRIIEVTPSGRIVWEYYAPWAPYDVERIRYGDEPSGPTIREQNKTGRYAVTGGAGLTPGAGEQLTFAEWLAAAFAGTPLEEDIEWVATRWSHIAPWVRPVWLDPWAFVAALGASLVGVCWMGVELIHRRQGDGARRTGRL